MAELTPKRLSADDPDLPAIVTLLHDCFAYMTERIDPPSSLHKMTKNDLTKQADEHEIWAIGSPPVACVFLTSNRDHLYLSKLAVTPGERGRGLAKQLVNLAKQRTTALGFKKLHLKTRIELTENHAAFSALGFHKVAQYVHPGYDRPTALTFELDIP